MYLSRVALDTENRETVRLLSSPQLLHGAVEGCFAGNRQRNLWRVDWLQGVCYLLILSMSQPDFKHIVTAFGMSQAETGWATKDYLPFLQKLTEGQKWQFRLTANPVRSGSVGKESSPERGKVFAHVTKEQQKKWLVDRAEAAGFSLVDSEFDVIHTQWKRFGKGNGGGNIVTLRTATFEGLLTITDAELFRQTLQSGIGRAKAYGCGLLTLASSQSG